ncbi:hypothetical protein KAJ89_04865 [Candidatus Parcubacteria bacterium]|nr:hypothetical protein [Candidatus Parcubacteria bacterium]
MRNKIYYFITLLFLLFPVLTVAQTFALPIHEQERSDNQKEEERLISVFGGTAFYACLACLSVAKTNPFVWDKCLRETEYCLLKQEVPVPNCQSSWVVSGGVCITIDIGCKEKYGENSYYDGTTINNKYNCECCDGFVWNADRSACSESLCPGGMIYYSEYRLGDNSILHGRCLNKNDADQTEYGEGAKFVGNREDDATLCSCQKGYEYNIMKAQCEEKITVAGISGPSKEEINYIETIERELGQAGFIDNQLACRLKGKILLQVEERGEAWYVHPDTGYKYYLSSPAKALAVMRELGLGATSEFISTRTYYPAHVWGRILIDIEDLGKAYYIDPVEKKAYYLGSPEQAYRVMRERSLGISNEDIRKIEIGEL